MKDKEKIKALKASNNALLKELEQAKAILLEAKHTSYMGAGSDGKSIWLIPCDYMRNKIMDFINKPPAIHHLHKKK